MFEDLAWFGFEWDEGPDRGGPHAPYEQSRRTEFYRAALDRLRAQGLVYACACSRKDIRSAAAAPHGEDEPRDPGRGADDEVLYPGTCRERPAPVEGERMAWRFRVPDGERIAFADGRLGECAYTAGRDFGDFVIWRPDDLPAYQLACVVDDAAMGITEVVRGEDLLVSTARQLLLYRALALTPPAFHHAPLMADERGVRLAKRHDALSLRALREAGGDPAKIRRSWGE